MSKVPQPKITYVNPEDIKKISGWEWPLDEVAWCRVCLIDRYTCDAAPRGPHIAGYCPRCGSFLRFLTRNEKPKEQPKPKAKEQPAAKKTTDYGYIVSATVGNGLGLVTTVLGVVEVAHDMRLRDAAIKKAPTAKIRYDYLEVVPKVER